MRPLSSDVRRILGLRDNLVLDRNVSNVFISHSSRDKPFVRRLACALLTEGFPVWLDAWNLDLGDSLLDEIYDGIDTSSLVILVSSERSIVSGWVNKEVNAALAKEEQVGRKFLIPIRLDASAVPLKVADRLYADFSSSFSEPFAAIVRRLEKQKAREMDVAPERELLGLSFTREVHLDQVSYRKNLQFIRKRHPDIELSSDQVVVADDAEYETLRKRLHARLDNMANDPYFSPEFEMHLRGTLEDVRRYEQHLATGVALLTNHHRSDESVYWFAKIMRGRAVYALWSAQSPNAPDLLVYGQKWRCADISTNHEAAEFFGIEVTTSIDLWPGEERRSNYFHLWAEEAVERRILNDKGAYEGPIYADDAFQSADKWKYVVPQMVALHLRDGTPMFWEMEGVSIGLS